MAHWDERRYAGRGAIRPFRIRTLLVIVLLACAAGYSAYKQWTTKYGYYRHWTRQWTAPHAAITGKPWVIDGDTVDISGQRVRLEGIDAPEAEQTCADAGSRRWRCGQAATQELKAYLGSRELKCAPDGFDRYRRVLAVCALADGSDVNAWMVRQGWAVSYGVAYQSQQAEAQAARRGIWAGKFTPPSEWRKQHRD